ncbi:hypothetical protein LTR05_007637 [Lithohypha guttulata]|uniref:Calcineurin-like phosphoesterase domain-containing protein n=1 Tax=Lithohypha guttulata TaxID=1690604 RepID=A0AAN7Y3X6_9EURO|nr:hypothetical protein LTR05_007637 [Lithohypha guttulata]
MNIIMRNVASIVTIWIATSQAIQPGAAPAQSGPLRELDFGDINFLHTTDTHGWHAGHILESSYSADWGDYISFSRHLRNKLEVEGRDLLVIDTGDRIEGNGLYDASVPRGKYTFNIFSQQHIDILCTGNHELYKNSSAEDDYLKLVPAYKNNYLASNLQIIDPTTGVLSYVARTHRKFTTKKQGLRIMAMGFIFDFTRNDKNTIVIPVEVAVKQPWFQEAIRDRDVDLFVIIGHVGLRAPEFELIHREIRSVNADIPIQFFGGHFHTRDYRVFDAKSHALASGRFMETVGFQSLTFSNTSNTTASNVTFSRRYIDNNLYSLHHHSDTNPSTFSTPSGLRTSGMITHARSILHLDQTFGCAPQNYWMSRTPYPHPKSIFSLIVDNVFPTILNPTRQTKSRLLLTNTGAIRFDIFKGRFTRDSTYIVSPFTSNFSYLPDVPYRLASKLLPILNGEGRQTLKSLNIPDSTMKALDENLKLDLTALPPPEQRARNHEKQHLYVSGPYMHKHKHLISEHRLQSRDHQRTQEQQQHDLKAQDSQHQTIPKTAAAAAAKTKPQTLTPGYTTLDDLGRNGDDTIHSPIQFYDVPNCVQALFVSNNNNTSNSKTLDNKESTGAVVDVVFNHFLMPYILQILNLLPQDNDGINGETEGRLRWSVDDVSNYVPGETFTSLLAKWVGENWGKYCDSSEFQEQGRNQVEMHFEL